METLEDYNRRMGGRYDALHSNAPRPSGIACTVCGKELMDSNPMLTLMSSPPQKNVHCPACGFMGYRVA